MGAWIEMPSNKLFCSCPAVAPHVGAWIEIFVSRKPVRRVVAVRYFAAFPISCSSAIFHKHMVALMVCLFILVIQHYLRRFSPILTRYASWRR
ncbi:MAG TPA: hypothetical protein DCK95_01495 [Anaerolineaceae bacterium]|nr:hypothetical protein [Anaerolineaceae bacterium]